MKSNKAFTLVELIVSITLFALIIVVGFKAMSGISMARLSTMNSLDVNQDIYYVTEDFVTMVKDFGGDIDYEEYWDRQARGTATSSGHYELFTGYGNYGSGADFTTNIYGDHFYHCRSGSGDALPADGCLVGYNSYSTAANSGNLVGKPQRYGQYALQFFDRNSNQNDDTVQCNAVGLGSDKQIGDEDCNGNIVGDDDDSGVGKGPAAFSGNEVEELYLIRKGKVNERFLLRLNIHPDPARPAGMECTSTGGAGCIGNIEVLRLRGRDYGYKHTGNPSTSSGVFDGFIDTWECDSNFDCSGEAMISGSNLPSGSGAEWLPIFPNDINVKELKIFIYPNKEYRDLAYKENSDSTMNPLVRIHMRVGYSWTKRRAMNLRDPDVSISTSINLTKN